MLENMHARASLLALGILAIVGCGGDGSNDSDGVDAAVTADAASAEAATDSLWQTSVDVVTATDQAAATGQAATAGQATAKGRADSGAPGRPVSDPATVGTGACAGKTLQSVVDAVWILQPSLADIQRIDSSEYGFDGDFIYAYSEASGGFALIFQRGSGDCPSGCTAHEYWYFETDDTCSPQGVGHYSSAWTDGNCIAVEGTPLWNEPPALDPVNVCGADKSAQNMSGTYTLQGVGDEIACTAAKGDEPRVSKTVSLQMIVAQDAQDLSKGTVTFTGIGNTAVDGHAIPATFLRRRFTASQDTSNLPSTCPEDTTLSVSFDFEGASLSELRFTEMRSLSCPESGYSDYCKGYINLTLTLVQN
jgi:hypothetical protein